MVEEDEVYHYCDDYKGGRDGRSIKITGITEARSSYSVDQVEYRFLDTGEESSMSLDSFQSDVDHGRFQEGRPEDCGECQARGEEIDG